MEKESRLFTPVLLIGCSIVLVGFAIRASFGVFQIPIQEEFGWPRSEFSLAIAMQNLAWGFGAPFFGAFAEKIGDKKAINKNENPETELIKVSLLISKLKIITEFVCENIY